MEKGDDDLAHVLKSYCQTERKLSPHLIRFYWNEMLIVVNEIHKHNVVHSDLKPVNFILVSGKLKIIDFGIADAIQTNKTSVYKDCVIGKSTSWQIIYRQHIFHLGTFDYMAPESFQKDSKFNGKKVCKYNQKADIWSLGIILYNLVYNKTPFSDFKKPIEKAFAISSKEIDYPPIDDLLLLDVIKVFYWWNQHYNCSLLLQKCLQRDPNKRPTAEELLNHEYLTSTAIAHSSSSQQLNSTGSGVLCDALPNEELVSKLNALTPRRLRYVSQVCRNCL